MYFVTNSHTQGFPTLKNNPLKNSDHFWKKCTEKCLKALQLEERLQDCEDDEVPWNKEQQEKLK